MSAPAVNALSPAPVITITRTSPSAFSALSTPGSAARMSADKALCLPGLLKITVATGPDTSTSSRSVPVSWRAAGLGDDDVIPVLSDHCLCPEPADLRGRVAKAGEHLVGVVAVIRCRRPDGIRPTGHPHRVTDYIERAEHRVLHRLGH